MTFKEFLRILTFHLLTASLGYGAYYLIREVYTSDGLTNLNIPIRSYLTYGTFSVLLPEVSETQFQTTVDIMTCICIVMLASAFGYALLQEIGVRRASAISSGECIICSLGYLLILVVVVLVSLIFTNFKDVQTPLLIIAPIAMFGLSYLLKLHNQNQEPKRAAKRYYQSNGR